jgi:ribonuclease J
MSLWTEREISWVLENKWKQLSRNTGGKAPEVDWMGVQREVEVGLGRRMRRELQVEPLILCLVQPAPAGTAVYKGRADAEPDNRPSPRGRRGGGGHPVRRNGHNNGGGTPAPIRQPGRTDAAPARPAAPAAVVEKVQPKPAPEPEMPSGRTRRRRSAAA